MLFYVEVCKEAKRLDQEPGVLVELSAYRLLMDPALTWPGNVRQIQAIAEKAVRAADDDKSYIAIRGDDVDGSTSERATNDLWILQRHVQAALKEEFPDILGREDKRSRENGYGVG
jgi:transcriptional regulator with PAS, ATPase and Fis domain